ncbi:hypothetical protein RSAG8_02986, partial [Rhizoctonia solani AG-8 WAC10335]
MQWISISVCLSIKQCYPQGKASTTTQELFSSLDSESVWLPLLEIKLKEAEAAVNWTRNLSNSLIPINKLPPELLAHVFQLLPSWQSRAQKTRGSLNGKSAKYPGALSHVSSHWRRVAISSCSLWTRIDLCTLDSIQQGLLDRAKTYAQRAGVLLLDVRLTDPPGPSGPRYSHAARLRPFFTAFAHRVRSLELIIQEKIPQRIQDYKLSDFFERCVSGTFTEFVARKNPTSYDKTGACWDDDDYLDSCIRASDDASHEDEKDLFLTIDEARLEQFFRSLTVLHLDRIYPPWSSNAYHGLIELRLTGEECIREADLVKVLSAIPGLRTLVLGIGIRDTVPPETPITPITLQNLEILHTHRTDCDELGLLFRWLAPGTRPLFLSLDGSCATLDLSEICIRSFFGHSNILAIEGIEFTDETANESLSMELPSLRALYMLQCEIDLEVLAELVQPNRVQTLVLYGCPVFSTPMQTKARLTSCHAYSIRFLVYCVAVS